MANVTFEKLSLVVYKYLEQQLADKADFLCKYYINTMFVPDSENSYCHQTTRYPTRYEIVLGGECIKTMLSSPDTFSKIDSHTEFSRLFKAFVGLFLHEMGHILYTDFSYDLTTKYTGKEKAFAHSVYNLLEDIVIEQRGICVNYPSYKKFIHFLNDACFFPQAKLYKDTEESLANLLNFFLLKLRLGKRFTGTHALYVQHEATLSPLIKAVLIERDPIQRKKNVIPLIDFLLTLKKPQEELPRSKPTTTDSSHISPRSQKAQALPESGDPSPESALSSAPSEEDSNEGEDSEEGEGSNSSDEDGDTESSSSKRSTKGEDTDDGSDATDEDADTDDGTPDFVEDTALDLDKACSLPTHILTKRHLYLKLSDYIDYVSLSSDRSKDLLDAELMGQSIKREIDVMKRLVKPRAVAGFTSGKISIPTITSSKSTGIKTASVFNQQCHIGRSPDLAVSVLVDCSGSMGCSSKCVMAWKACQAISYGLDSLRIPFEINLFTTTPSNDALTIGVKALKDSYKTIKELVPIIDEYAMGNYNFKGDFPGLFCANVDESSLYYVYSKFKHLRQKDKLILVLSDGETCGYEGDLKELVSVITKEGIGVIGIGLRCTAVARIYPEHKIFSTEAELLALPTELGNLITNFYKRKGGLI